MIIYKNPWVSRESYFVKTGTAHSARMEASKTSGYSVDFWNGEWIVRKTAYYNNSLEEMPVIVNNRVSFLAEVDKAIVSIVLGFIEESKKDADTQERGDGKPDPAWNGIE